MAREFIVHEGSVHSEAGFLLDSSEAFLLFCMIVVSLSIISMVIFACGYSNSGQGRPDHHNDSSGCDCFGESDCCGGDGEDGGGGDDGASGSGSGDRGDHYTIKQFYRRTNSVGDRNALRR